MQNNKHGHFEVPELPVLIGADEIARRVYDMGQQISKDFAGQSVTVIGALKGCFIFMSDLVRAIDVPAYVDFIEVSSYGNEMETSGVVKITKDFSHTLEDQHIILVEDIIDTGITLNFLVDNILLRKPKSVHIAALLVKHEKMQLKHPVSYRGFDIPDKFVVGYGMDYRGFFRNVNYIGYVEKESQLKLF